MVSDKPLMERYWVQPKDTFVAQVEQTTGDKR